MVRYEKLRDLVNIDSPSGYTHEATEYIIKTLKEYGWDAEYTNKGAVTCKLGDQPKLVIAAHVDTLGAIVSGVNGDGTLRFSNIGGLKLNSYEGCYCRIRTAKGKVYTGTVLLNNPAVHVNKEISTTKRELSKMHVRVDEVVESAEDIKKLNINVGDFICFEPHYQETESGFIKSKYMDNKASCLVLFEIARAIKESGKNVPVELFFSNYEEVGHGAATGYSPTVDQMLCLDMGVVGSDVEGKETHCSICVKDSSGPYDYEMRNTLVNLADERNILYKLDVYPYYGSDGSAALRAGNNFKVALIGMGVSASHGVERTHKNGIKATIDLCLAYINQIVN